MRNKTPSAQSGVRLVVLLPHAPILIPAVAGERAGACRRTTEAMREVARRLVASAPDTVVLVSPHAERDGHSFGISTGSVSGSLERFGAPGVGVRLPGDPEFSAALLVAAQASGVAAHGAPDLGGDHGSVVPLWFLQQAGWQGPTVVVALTWTMNEKLLPLGECVAAVTGELGRRVAVVASGDMSHRLSPAAPCGFDPRAKNFDAAFIGGLRAGATRELADAVAPSRGCAAEDVLDPTLFACGAAGWRADGREVLGYEGPFGVGYGVAVLHAAGAEGAATDSPGLAAEDLPALARRSIAAALGLEPTVAEPEPGTLPGANGVFVTLHGPDGVLRGCIGTTRASSGDLAVEAWRMARAAALRDPRFAPVRAEELAGLRIEVTVLDAPEPVGSEAALDPGRWGVVVTAADGRRGLLLPDLPTVTTVAEQVAIARRKGRIGPEEAVAFERFGARRYREKGVS